MRSRPVLRLLTALAVLAGAQLGLAWVAAPASAADREIVITADGPDPVTLAGVRIGDVIVFRNGDGTFPHTVRSTSDNWSFEATINPGTSFKVPEPLKAAGRYTYGDNSPLEDFAGEVVVGSTATAKPTRSPTRSPTPKATTSRSATPTPTPTPTGGSGVVGAPPLIGGGLPGTSPTPGQSGPPPLTAPEPTETSEAPSGTVALPGGTLPEPPTPREYGLPAAVATVGAVGAASLLARFLLAHPAARRRPDGPVVTVEQG